MRANSLAIYSVAALLAACGDPSTSAPASEPATGVLRSGLSITEVAQTSCDTPPELVDGLSRQLVEAINCMRPGTLADIPIGGDIGLLREGRPAYVDARGLDDLLDAAAAGDRQMIVRWSYRDVALQHLFWLQDDFRGCAVAAPAGLSNHQNGLAVDLNDWQYWQPIMSARGWLNALPNDRVHFDYQLAQDVGLGALSLRAFQALWNKNNPARQLALTSELDGDTYEALSEAPIEGFALDLCEGGNPPVGPGPVRGPTVAQAAWRGCEPPAELIEGLSVQIAGAMNCVEDDVLRPLPLCNQPGCVTIAAPPIVEWLGSEAHAALLDVSEEVGRAIEIRWAFRDVALQHFLASAQDNIGCPAADDTARSLYNGGQAVLLSEFRMIQDELETRGFSNFNTGQPNLWKFSGGRDLTSANVLAFQMLWNLNRPDDPIDDDGLIGPMTRGAIGRSPIDGFPLNLCGPVGPPPDSGVRDDMGPPRDAGPDAAPDPDDGVPPLDAGEDPDGAAVRDARPPTGRDAARDAVADPDGTVLGRGPTAPVRGWTAVSDDAGCTSAPGGAGWWLLGVFGARVRRRRQ